MKLELLLWAVFMPVVWILLGEMPALLRLGGAPVGALLAVGFVGSTALVFAVERRLPIGRVLPLSWKLRRPLLLVPAFLLGVGALILASEIDNVVRSVWPVTVPAAAPETGPEPPLWSIAAYLVVVAPVTRVLVFSVLVARAFLVLVGRRGAVLLAGLGGGLLIGLSLPQQIVPQALLFGLCAWVHVSSGSVWLPLAVGLPVCVLNGLDLAGLGPGIAGFDLPPSGAVVFQPVWFDLLGAALVAVGGGALMRAFEPPPQPPPKP